ncbi:MAG: bifunctional phosphoribosylaminoimidazolecarboxamide formyltransferase/IMP cyclohydrolase [Candidatus Planktophila sp.]|jgi:phosphoribosylaminoimidazolecarboxamide formyltransferase/IMP cyclohydrolase|nr:bifunctional phosphoribosylaminoimidazolecarboxamide formyltransferase/IMP cyclohydrolase [Candidatus Planktophila sp.]MBP7805420.1 bifunctional phosphoribosylaminoimidazolecarboxamide formyltransferase/IMP cyclohydrolase [Candidatus Planktophila sp.]
MSNRKKVRRALISVYDKSRLEEIGKVLNDSGVEILSTGSTAKTLSAAGIPVTEVSEITGFPEIMGGRVKTLHPTIHSGILADQSNSEHMSAIKNLGIDPFDLIIINLYPFAQTIASGASFAECIEQIDIGGPSMLRGAAKNHGSVAVISKTDQYDHLLASIAAGGFTSEERQKLALDVFRTTAEYDLTIANWLGQNSQTELPEWFGRIFTKENTLRYGENPHQGAAIYRGGPEGIVQAKQLHGKEMSFNNYTDADAAWRAAHDHTEPCVAIIKHANPCGIAIGKDIADAYTKAHECDSVSAFGGVVAANRVVTTQMAQALSEIFTEVLIAPGYESAALEILRQKPSIRILECDSSDSQAIELRPVSGGALLQEMDVLNAPGDASSMWNLVAGAQVNVQTMKDLEFAWRAVRAVKSNAILLAKDGASVGVGMGQVNRVDSAELAVKRAGNRAAGSVASSDAFFPFADGLQILINAGITAVVSPGGSVRDEEVIAAANQAGISLYFTGTRHFSHA